MTSPMLTPFELASSTLFCVCFEGVGKAGNRVARGCHNCFVSTRRVPMVLSGILAYNCVCRKATCDTIRTACHHYQYHSFIGSFLSSRGSLLIPVIPFCVETRPIRETIETGTEVAIRL